MPKLKPAPARLLQLPPAATLLLFAAVSLSPTAPGHPGALDENGGHIEWRTGEYHCHGLDCETRDDVDLAEYHRSAWPHWVDESGNCLDTRQEVLVRDSVIAPALDPQDECRVVDGLWVDPFTGHALTKLTEIDVDHIVPLRWAHERGGWAWDSEKRRAFANDPDNLVAVARSLNQSKGASGPADWMPPRTAFWCEYLARWGLVLTRYHLSYDEREEQAAALLRDGCPGAG